MIDFARGRDFFFSILLLVKHPHDSCVRRIDLPLNETLNQAPLIDNASRREIRMFWQSGHCRIKPASPTSHSASCSDVIDLRSNASLA